MNAKKLFFLAMVVTSFVQVAPCRAQEDCDGANQTCHEQCSKAAANPKQAASIDNLNSCWDNCDQTNEQCLSALGM